MFVTNILFVSLCAFAIAQSELVSEDLSTRDVIEPRQTVTISKFVQFISTEGVLSIDRIFKVEKNYRITKITYEEYNNSGSLVSIKKGGPGFDFVILTFENQLPEQESNFNIEIESKPLKLKRIFSWTL